MSEDRMNPNPRITTCEELETIVAQQNELINGMADLVKAMDARIRVLTGLVDAHHTIFERQGFVKPRPEGDQRVN
jgi:hypothetical protein